MEAFQIFEEVVVAAVVDRRIPNSRRVCAQRIRAFSARYPVKLHQLHLAHLSSLSKRPTTSTDVDLTSRTRTPSSPLAFDSPPTTADRPYTFDSSPVLPLSRRSSPSRDFLALVTA